MRNENAVKLGKHRAIAWAASVPWAIQRAALDQILQIAARDHTPDFEAVLARQGEMIPHTERAQLREGGVAIVNLHGPIFQYANLFTRISGATSIEQAALDLRTVSDDPRVRAVVLNIDSPGGAMPGVSEFAKQVRATRKPVIAYVSGTAASAAYWIAAAAHWIVMSDTALAGSIGVVAGVRVDGDETIIEVVSSQSPNKNSDPRTAGGRAQLQRMVDDLATVFVNSVAEYRGVTSKKVLNDFGAGDVLVGSRAVAAGLADQIGTLEEVIASYAPGSYGPADQWLRTNASVQSQGTQVTASRSAWANVVEKHKRSVR